MNKDGYFVTKCCKSGHWCRKAGDRKNVFCWKCNKWTTLKFISHWKKEFEDEIHFVGEVETNEYYIESLELENNNFPELVMKYIGEERTKIRIKARKGAILIEEIK